MISSNTRASRSRYSSPAAQGAHAATPTPAPGPGPGSSLAPWSSPLQLSKNSGNEGSKSLMQRWLEPSLQSKPSFEEAGLVRHGVLENMAPLGSLPKAKKNGTENGGSGARKIALKTSAVAKAAKQAREANDSGTDTTEPTNRRLASAPPPSRRSVPTKGGDDDDDDDYNPKGAARRRNARRASSIPNGRASDDKAQQETSSAESNNKSRRSRSVSKILVSAAQEMKPEDKASAEKAIEAAIEEALKHYQYPTAWALRTLYEEKAGDKAFETMITDIFSQAADEESLSEFARQVEEKTREGKRDNEGCYYSVPPPTDGKPSANRAKVASSTELPHQDQEQDLDGKANVNHGEQGSEGDEAGKAAKRASDKAASTGGDETRAAKKAKTSHIGDEDAPSKGAAATTATTATAVGVDGTAGSSAAGAAATATTASSTAQDAAADAGADTANTTQTPSRKRRRRDSASSDSSLSSAMSLPSPEARRTSLSPLLRRGATPAGTTSTSAGARRSKPQDAPKSTKPQPINTRGKSVASSDSASASASASEPNSPTASLANTSTKHHRSAHDSMPGRLAASGSASASASELFPNLQARAAGKGAKDSKASKASKDSPDTVDSPMQDVDIEVIFNRRRDAQRITNGYTAAESSVRGPRQRRDATPVRKTRKTRQSLTTPYTTRTTRSATKKPNDDVDTTLSPVALSFHNDDGSTTAGSRAVTPGAQKQGKKSKGLRVKSS